MSPLEELAADLFHGAYGKHNKQMFSDMPQYIQDMWIEKAGELAATWFNNPLFISDKPGKEQVVFEIELPKGASPAVVGQRIHDILEKMSQQTERLVNTEAPEQAEAAAIAPIEALFSGREIGLGKIAYDAFIRQLVGIPNGWDNLSDDTQQAWCAAAKAVRDAVAPVYDEGCEINENLRKENSRLMCELGNLQLERNKYASETNRLQAEHKATTDAHVSEIRELEETRKRLLEELNHAHKLFQKSAEVAIADVTVKYNNGHTFVIRPNHSSSEQEPLMVEERPICKCGHDKMNHYAGFGGCDVKGCNCAGFMEPAPAQEPTCKCGHPRARHYTMEKPHNCTVRGCDCFQYKRQ